MDAYNAQITQDDEQRTCGVVRQDIYFHIWNDAIKERRQHE